MSEQALAEVKSVAQAQAAQGFDIVGMLVGRLLPILVAALEKELKELLGIK